MMGASRANPGIGAVPPGQSTRTVLTAAPDPQIWTDSHATMPIASNAQIDALRAARTPDVNVGPVPGNTARPAPPTAPDRSRSSGKYPGSGRAVQPARRAARPCLGHDRPGVLRAAGSLASARPRRQGDRHRPLRCLRRAGHAPSGAVPRRWLLPGAPAMPAAPPAWCAVAPGAADPHIVAGTRRPAAGRAIWAVTWLA